MLLIILSEVNPPSICCIFRKEDTLVESPFIRAPLVAGTGAALRLVSAGRAGCTSVAPGGGLAARSVPGAAWHPPHSCPTRGDSWPSSRPSRGCSTRGGSPGGGALRRPLVRVGQGRWSRQSVTGAPPRRSCHGPVHLSPCWLAC